MEWEEVSGPLRSTPTPVCACVWEVLAHETYVSVEARSCSSVQQLRTVRYQVQDKKQMRKTEKREERKEQDES